LSTRHRGKKKTDKSDLEYITSTQSEKVKGEADLEAVIAEEYGGCRLGWLEIRPSGSGPCSSLISSSTG